MKVTIYRRNSEKETKTDNAEQVENEGKLIEEEKTEIGSVQFNKISFCTRQSKNDISFQFRGKCTLSEFHCSLDSYTKTLFLDIQQQCWYMYGKSKIYIIF